MPLDGTYSASPAQEKYDNRHKACRRKGDPMRDNFPVGHELSKCLAGAHWWPGKPIPLLAWLAAVCSGRNLMKSIFEEVLHLD